MRFFSCHSEDAQASEESALAFLISRRLRDSLIVLFIFSEA